MFNKSPDVRSQHLYILDLNSPELKYNISNLCGSSL